MNPCRHSGWTSVAGICLHPEQDTPSWIVARQTVHIWELIKSCLQRMCNMALSRYGQIAQGHWRHDWLTASLVSCICSFQQLSSQKWPSFLSFSNQSRVKRNAETIPENEREADFIQPISLLLRAATNSPQCKSSLICRLRDKVVLSAPMSLHKSTAIAHSNRPLAPYHYSPCSIPHAPFCQEESSIQSLLDCFVEHSD